MVDIKEASQEIKSFKKDFESFTGIKVYGLIEDRSYFHWKRLVLKPLNCEEMQKISEYILYRFSKYGVYTHLMPSLSCFDGYLCLTVDRSYIHEFIKD